MLMLWHWLFMREENYKFFKELVMTFLSASQIREGVELFNLVEDHGSLDFIEGSSLDLKLGRLFIVENAKHGIPRITIEDRKSYGYLEIDDMSVLPGVLYRETKEKVNLPEHLFGLIFSRVTLGECGLILLYTRVSPGFSGRLRFGLFNVGSAPVQLQRGASIASIMFGLLGEGETDPYAGDRA